MTHLIYDNDDGLLVEFSVTCNTKYMTSDAYRNDDRWEIDITKAWLINEDGFIQKEFTTGRQLTKIERHVGARGYERMKAIAKGNELCSERPRYRCELPEATCQSTDARQSHCLAGKQASNR